MLLKKVSFFLRQRVNRLTFKVNPIPTQEMKEYYIIINACIFKQVKVGVYSETTTLQFFIIIKNSALFLR